ncbi:alpha-mannosidase [Paenibacillus barcinonensis]|uniref:Alpha-mannosidase n=1 Tax=Paenibacillus barcinonensis TaxID=198119 RepID=A0A2V4V6R8_PAEBA|nr:alpha-mannosidase [Paenibacillus barcinonensis]PYE48229.1 alpha-mannosidase [Paenibacillus barcinonensis]QKS56920.1 alpha-mannosidase [Paenibacillus barcinonensis]
MTQRTTIPASGKGETGTKTKRAHIISHTHWDREWYLPYEKHHMRLVKLVDSLLDQLDKRPDYHSFYLDGQTIIIEDYLQVRPEQKQRLEKYIRSGRIVIGPWYILQDAFLTSGEANVRNMQVGHRDAKRYGTPAKIGYFPDTFGLVGQTPQLMLQSGIDNVFFGRGVKPTGFNNTVSDDGYESSYSELIWEGPDGSKVLGVLFANWYSNGNEVPADKAAAQAFWEKKLADAEKYASTSELLFMNGCDHQPIQRDLPQAIRTAEQLFPEVEFVHSNFPEYLHALRASCTQELSTIRGELRSQRTDGWGTLVNTASARVYLKQMNQHGQVLLEKVAEPLAAIAHLLGHAYPHDQLTYAWKTLMQNHPHDSICGCSVDEVHREMVTRFEKSRHTAEAMIEESTGQITSVVDTSIFDSYGEEVRPLVVFNTTGWERSGIVHLELDAARLYFREGFSLEEMAERMTRVDLSGRVLVDDSGEQVSCTVEDLGLQFGYDLPDNRFRQPYSCRRVRVTFEAQRVPALGWKAYAWVPLAALTDVTLSDEAAASPPEVSAVKNNGVNQGYNHADPIQSYREPENSLVLTGERGMENKYLRVQIADNGSFTVTDKQTGRMYSDLGMYENVGDIGNEYMFKQPQHDTARTTKELKAAIRLLQSNDYVVSFEIIHHWSIPISADEQLDREQRELVYYPHRQARRSQELVTMRIRTVVSLSYSGRGVEVESSFDNKARDHRVRMLFPTDLQTDVHYADSMFEIARRDNAPAPEWQNPSNTQHQQSFVDVCEDKAGLVIANRGLNEYEVLQDGRNTIAVTLLRAVGELGDWGLFPTPEAQCLGAHTFHMQVIPHDGHGSRSGAYKEAYQFQVPWTLVQTEAHPGYLPPVSTLLAWKGEDVAFSSLKVNEDSGDLMLRWFNMGTGQTAIKLAATQSNPKKFTAAYQSNILEEEGEQHQPCSYEKNPSPLSFASEGWSIPVSACEIVTAGLRQA